MHEGPASGWPASASPPGPGFAGGATHLPAMQVWSAPQAMQSIPSMPHADADGAMHSPDSEQQPKQLPGPHGSWQPAISAATEIRRTLGKRIDG